MENIYIRLVLSCLVRLFQTKFKVENSLTTPGRPDNKYEARKLISRGRRQQKKKE